MPSVSYDLALEILFRLFCPGGRALQLRRIQAVDFGICYLDCLKYSAKNPKEAAKLHRRTLNAAKNTHGIPLTDCIITPGGSWSPTKRLWLEKLLNTSSVLTGLRDEVQLELPFEASTGPALGTVGTVDRADSSESKEGEGLSLAELDIF